MFKNKKTLFLVILISLLLFLPGLDNFFSSDDWFHLRITQISSVSQFFNFFSFSQTAQSTPFLRPLSTQVFFFIFQTFFGLNVLPYHLFIFFVFASCLYLIFKFGLLIFEDKQKAIVVTFIYGISVTNFVRLYFISVVQELLMLLFLLFSFIQYSQSSRKSKYFAFLFFVLALLSKETAIVLPLILISYDFLKKRINLAKVVPYFLITIPYLYLRLQTINTGVTSSYLFDFSLHKLFNTTTWYFLWSLGTPELLVDYVGSSFKILSRFYTDFPFWSKIILPIIGLTLISFFALIVQNLKKIGKEFLLGVAIFIVGLLPVIFLPTHKFTLQLTLPMIGFSILCVSLFKIKYRNWLVISFLLCYSILNLATNLLTYQTHYSVSRSRISQRVFNYFSTNYPKPDKETYFEFINDSPNYGKEWGGSKQISQAVSESDLFKVLYKDSSYGVYYEDSKEDKRPFNKTKVVISTQIFLK